MPNKSNPLPNKAMLMLRTLVQRRTRRASWAYMLWFLAWLPFMLFFADFVFSNLRPFQWLPLLVPLAVVTVQIVYPTLLGWAVIMIPSVYFAGGGVVAVIIAAPARDARYEPQGLVISSVAAGIYVLVCVALWFARPKRSDAAAVPPTPASYEQE